MSPSGFLIGTMGKKTNSNERYAALHSAGNVAASNFASTYSVLSNRLLYNASPDLIDGIFRDRFTLFLPR